MKRILLSLLLVAQLPNIKAQIAIIPEPFEMSTGIGNYTLPKSIVINASNAASSIGELIATKLKTVTGNQVNFASNKSCIDIQLINEPSLGKEGYHLVVNEKGIQMRANSNAGLFYAWQSLLQIMPTAVFANSVQNNTSWKIPFITITDKPRFGWRGLMLDVSRHFFTKAEVKQYIDNMVLYKYNVLHLHLTDDQGWRIEIKVLPKLTQVGAWRVDRKGKWGNITTPSLDEPKTYGGFYTQEDIKELVAYAKSKFVEILPEIDIPGHSLSFLSAYPLSTTPHYNYQVNAGTEFMDWTGVNGHATAMIDNALNPANETVYNYLDQIFTEVAALFPFGYIHMGGDENAKNNWEKSSEVQSLMKRENLKDQHEVQSYFVKRVEKIINSKGKKLMGWDEILEGGLPGNAAVMSWRGMQGGIDAATQKHQVVMTPNDFVYIDFYQGEATAEGKVYRGLRMKKTYEFEPLPQGIDPSYILGGQANLWTEQVLNLRSAQYLTWPRSMSVAETLWSPKEKKNWKTFSDKVEKQFDILDVLNVKYAKSIYDPIVTTVSNTKGELIASMEGEVDNLKFYYSIDESLPDHFSDEYKAPFVLPSDVTILRIISYRNGKPIGKMLNIPIESLQKRAVKVL
ncbi:MAG: family 20 glycosylhydrolase [Bacteroidetes bacterium]|nr:family 20 glycosylhydrolase [Bacteroidota bacterium]